MHLRSVPHSSPNPTPLFLGHWAKRGKCTEMLVSTCQQTWRFSCFFVFSKRARANLFCIIGVSLSSLRKTKLLRIFLFDGSLILTTRNKTVERGHKGMSRGFFSFDVHTVYKTSKGLKVHVHYRSCYVIVNSATARSQNSVCTYSYSIVRIHRLVAACFFLYFI